MEKLIQNKKQSLNGSGRQGNQNNNYRNLTDDKLIKAKSVNSYLC